MRKLSGYSLIEVIVVLGIFFAISVIAMPIAIAQLQASRAESVLKDIRSAMFLVEQDAYTRKANSAYGIAFFSDHYISYAGNSLATATSQETYTISGTTRFANYSYGGSNELKFALGSFRPTAGRSVDITDATNSYRLNISAQGLITYTKL